MSPAQLLMGRRPRNLLPTSDKVLSPTGHSPSVVRSHFDNTKRKQKHYYDRRRGVKHLPQFHSGDFVRLQPQTGTKSWRPGTIVESHSPRSYMVDNGDSVVRRNRSHIRKSTEKANFTLPEPDINVNDSVESKPQPFGFPCSGGESVIVENARETGYVTKSGRVVKPPRKLDL